MADETVTEVFSNVGEKQGQAQAKDSAINPHDGKHQVDEAHIVTDRIITDANADDAVQVPEGVGASTAGHAAPLRAAYEAGTAEEQFKANQAEADKAAKKS